MSNSQIERQLILLSAGTVSRRRAFGDLARELSAEVDWVRLEGSLRKRRLLPTLGPRIVELAGPRASERFTEAVAETVATGRRHGAFLQLVCLRAIAMLAEAGIRAVALKGPLMAEAIYGDPGRRSSTDIDLLVPSEQLQQAVQVVRELSYGAPKDHTYDCGLPLLHYALVHERGELPPVELHWRVHWYEKRFAVERLLPPSVDRVGDWRPSRADELAALLLFYARDGFVDLRLATDLSAWWDVYGDQMPQAGLGEVIDAFPDLARVLVAASEVASRTVGLPAEHVLGERALGLRQRIAARLANPHPRSSLAQLYADIGLIDGLLAPPGGFGTFIRRQVLPPSEVLEQHARHGARARPRSAWSRGAGTLARYGLTLTRLARAPEAL